jgi:endonuclease/exonuclease/phosphatase family metal-dependent hydrolase
VLAGILAWGLAVTWSFGQIVRDATYAGQLAFYIPAPLVALALSLLALLAWAKGRRRAAIAAGLAALVPSAFVLTVEHRWVRAAAPAAAEGTIRVVHWNVRRGGSWERVVPIAVRENADLYAFSEPPYGGRERDVASALGFEGPPVRVGQVALLARGTLGPPQWLSRDALEVALVPWERDGVAWRVMVVDLLSDLRVARDPWLARLRALVEERQPDLVVGDLNAPRRSRALTPPPAGFVHAYDAAGQGWSATWPMPLPLWSIDHCLVGPRLQVTAYRLRSTDASDHRMQVVALAPRYHGATAR